MITTREPQTPSPRGIRLRARWLASLSPEEREQLPEMPLREVDRRFDAWKAEQMTHGRPPGV